MSDKGMEEEVYSEVYSIAEIQRIVAPIASKYGVERVYLFGSYARGEAIDVSDIDFIIDKGCLHGLQFAGMLGDLQEIFDKSIDLLTTSGVNDYKGNLSFKESVEKDMVLIYEQQ